jgi:hypothetical protein
MACIVNVFSAERLTEKLLGVGSNALLDWRQCVVHMGRQVCEVMVI